MHRLDVRTIKTKLNYKSDLNYKSVQNSMSCIDLTSKRSKMLSYVAKHSKQRKTTKPIKLQWIASIGCQNDQNKPKLQKWSKLDVLHCFDVKTIKMLSYVSKHSKQRKTTKPIKLQWIASIWRQNDQKCWVTLQNIQNNAKLQIWSNYNELHQSDVKKIKTMLNNISDENPMTCTSKR